MKQFIALMMLVAVLSSCGEAVAPTPADTPTQETEINTEIDAATDATTDTIDAELEELDKTESVETNETSTEEDLEALESSVENIQVVYSNPKQEVTADIEYSLDSEGKITSINITDSNYDITKHISDGNLDILIGKSLAEVEDTYIAGGSLTIPAVKKALSAEA